MLARLPGREIRLDAGQTLFLRGDPVRSMHAVREGRIHLIRHQPGGEALVLQRAAAPAILAEASLYFSRYHCAAAAETAATLWIVPIATLRQALTRDTKLAASWAVHLAHEVQQARLHAEILSMRTVRARLDAWMAWHGGLPARGLWLGIARDIGVTPEALYREIGKLRRRDGGP